MKLSQKIQAMELSPIRKFVPYADAARAAGKKVYGLNIGQPDIKTPRAFFDAVKNFDQEVLAYANSQGEKSLIEALIGYYKRIGIEFENKDILITNGGSEALSMIFTGILDEGDEVIIPCELVRARPFHLACGKTVRSLKVPTGDFIVPLRFTNANLSGRGPSILPAARPFAASKPHWGFDCFATAYLQSYLTFGCSAGMLLLYAELTP